MANNEFMALQPENKPPSNYAIQERVLPATRWGTALNYFIGSKEHNIRLRQRALERGLTLNEHALTRLSDGQEILCATEEELYARLGLPYIPPEIREDGTSTTE